MGKGVRQGCILSPCLFNLYAEYIMRNAGLEETQAGIKIAGRNINNLRYADDTHNWICRWNWRCKVLYLSLNYSYSSSVSVSLSPFISSNSSVTPDFIPFPIYVLWLIISSMFLLINKTLVVTVLSHQPGKIPNMNWSNYPLLMLAIYRAITIHANE